MRAVFAHDHIFTRTPEGEVFSTGKFPYFVWQRYLEVFDQLSVAGRSIDLPAAADCRALDLSSGPAVDFLPVAETRSAFAVYCAQGSIRNALRQTLAGADALIARLPSLIGSLAVDAARSLRKPWAVEVVGCAWDALWNYGTWQGKLVAPAAWLRTRSAVARAPFALYVTDGFLQRRYPCHGRSVSVSNVEVPPVAENILQRRLDRVEKEKKTLVIGCIASLSSAYKGIDTALQALCALAEEFPDFEFQVLGDGNAERWLQLASQLGIKGKVRFVGTLPAGEAVFAWLDTLDLYLQPSRQEGLPRALIEAMSRGCPALASKAGGIPELLRPEYLVQPGDHHALAALIIRFGLDPDWRRENAARNFRTAQCYATDTLNARRTTFWREFAAYVRTAH